MLPRGGEKMTFGKMEGKCCVHPFGGMNTHTHRGSLFVDDRRAHSAAVSVTFDIRDGAGNVLMPPERTFDAGVGGDFARQRNEKRQNWWGLHQ